MSTLLPETARRLDALVAREQSEHRLPSVVAGVVRDGELVWSAGAGVVDGAAPGKDVQYRCGSITKTFVAVSVMRLRDEGLLDLSDPLERHLPGTELGQVPVAQLLAHLSGLGAETPPPWWERTPGGGFAELRAGAVRLSAAGRRFHYSNVGYAFLGELVARRRGSPWADVMRAELLEPLGMRRTTVRPEPPAAPGLAVHPFADVVLSEPEHDAVAMAPAGQLWTTVSDLGRWAAFLARADRPERSAAAAGDSVLAASTLAEMREPRGLMDLPGQAWTTAYGLGIQLWNVDGHRSFGHGASMPGFLAELRIRCGDGGDDQAGDAAVVFANATSGLGSLSADLLDLLADLEPPQPVPWAPAAVADDVVALTGTWFWGPSPAVLRAGADGAVSLTPPLSPGRTSRFRPRGDGTWEGLDGYYAGEALRVVRRADGTALHLEVASFVLTRVPYDPDAGVPGGVDDAGWGTGDTRSDPVI